MKQTNTPEQVQRKIVLHFNLKKTILIKDIKQQDQTKEECLQEILVGYAWGRMESKDEKSPLQWKLVIQTFVAECPQEGLMSFKDSIDQQLPLKTMEDESDPSRLEEYNQQIIHQRRQQYYAIVKTGSPCIKLKPEYDRIIKTITIPKVIVEEIRMRQEEIGDPQTPGHQSKRNLASQLQEKDTMQDLFTEGKFHIIPTFYKTILGLKKLKREFAIVFRPFGVEYRSVLREFNKFCIGEHPCFSGRNNTPLVKFDGSKGTKNFLILEKQCGLFYRFDEDVQNTQLIMGSLRRGDRRKSLEDEYEKELEEEAITIQKSIQSIYVRIMDQLKESCSLCLEDDYEFYQNQQGKKSISKLLLVDQTDYDTLHIFFEEANSDHGSLIGVVDPVTCERIPKKKSFNKYIVKVDQIEALKDPDYFIKQIDLCEKLRTEEIERIEKGIPDEVPEIPKKSDFELLIESSDSEYLRQTILPLLQPALKLVDIERPVDPLSFIALYCLKNKDRVKIPQPNQEYLESLQQTEEQQKH